MPPHDGRVDEPVLEWLLGADVAVRFQAERDLRGREDPGLQARIGREGDGAVLLAARGSNGHWGRGFYQPKWTCSHYTLLELKNMGLRRDEPAAGETVATILRENRGSDGGVNPAKTIPVSDVCVNGMTLGYAAYFGAPEESLVGIVDYILGQRLPDGGFNCQFNRGGADHSSVHTTVSVIEGATEYERSGCRHRLAEVLEARATAVEFLLRHRLFRSERTGEPISPELTRLHHPARWHFDVLRGLDALADAGVPHDPRMDDALDVVASRRRSDGRWAASKGYAGATHLPPLPSRAPSPWVTLIALRVLKTYR